ncbi:overproduction-induced pheromone-resistant [Fusarium falciforme]
MGGSRYFVARDLDELERALQLVPRDNDCIECDDSTGLQCPKCSDGESCQFTVPLDCTQCATSSCMKDEEAESDKGGGGLNIGAIIGGIIGSTVVIAVATYLAWRFYIKPKRSQTPTSIKVEDMDPVQSPEKNTALGGPRPLSTHTVHSIAPTVLTRASNIIQIAYIPGVTNRATPTSPNLPAPLVLLIPVRSDEDNRSRGNDDQHFFVPSDLQNSTYSSLSGSSDRALYARTPYASRSNVTFLPRFYPDQEAGILSKVLRLEQEATISMQSPATVESRSF